MLIEYSCEARKFRLFAQMNDMAQTILLIVDFINIE